MEQLVHFILVPDGSAARRLRRMLATQSPCQGILVGTWPELIEQANSAYLVFPQVSNWKNRFYHALAGVPDAFWSDSFEVSPEETAAEVEAALSHLVGATEAGGDIVIMDSHQLPERSRKHIQDIEHLLHELDGLLPDELLAIQRLLSTAANAALRKIAVCRIEEFPSLTRWQVALIDKLNADAGIEIDAELKRLLESLLLDTSTV